MSRIVNSYETAARLHLVSGSFSHHQPAAGFHVETVHRESLPELIEDNSAGLTRWFSL